MSPRTRRGDSKSEQQQRPLLLVRGVSVLDAVRSEDCSLRGYFYVAIFLRWCVLARFRRWSLELIGKRFGQSPVAGIGLGFQLRVSFEQRGDALGVHRDLVVHPHLLPRVQFTDQRAEGSADRPAKLRRDRRTTTPDLNRTRS